MSLSFPRSAVREGAEIGHPSIIHPSIDHPSIQLCTHPFINTHTHLLVNHTNLSTCSSIYPPTHRYVNQSIHLSVHPPAHPFNYLSPIQSIHPPIHLPTPPVNQMCICSFIRPSFSEGLLCYVHCTRKRTAEMHGFKAVEEGNDVDANTHTQHTPRCKAGRLWHRQLAPPPHPFHARL